MQWQQQYGRYCRDCEYWCGQAMPRRKSQGFLGTEGICHRFPPARYSMESGQWARPVTRDTDGCGEFKRIWHVQPENETMTPLAQETPVAEPVVSTPEPQSLLLNAKQVATLLGISVSSFYSMRSCGRIPLPTRLGRSVRWNRQEILNWIEADCPPLNRWKDQREDRPKRPRK